jgi:hypothetical protein
MKATIDASLAARSDEPEAVLFNLGTNGTGEGLSRNDADQWKADVLYILDAMKAKWPGIHVYLARFWRPDENGDLTLANDTWTPAIIAARPGWVHLGMDERECLPGPSDNYLSDTYHPNHLGYWHTAVAWKVALGL